MTRGPFSESMGCSLLGRLTRFIFFSIYVPATIAEEAEMTGEPAHVWGFGFSQVAIVY
jgi:hypothetical protein